MLFSCSDIHPSEQDRSSDTDSRSSHDYASIGKSFPEKVENFFPQIVDTHSPEAVNKAMGYLGWFSFNIPASLGMARVITSSSSFMG